MKLRIVGLFASLGFASALCAGCDNSTEAAPEPPPEVHIGAIAQQLDDVVCDLAFDCECTYGRQFEERAQCTEWAQTQQSEAERIMDQYDLEWDPTCVGWYVRGFEELECASQQLFPNDPDGDGCFAGCAPLHGSKTEGQSCQQIENRFSDCDAGLRCQSGVCVANCPEPLALGDLCSNNECDEGLYCDFFDDAEPTCKEKAVEGADCAQVECLEWLRCVTPDPMDPTVARCELKGEIAEPCTGHDQCTTGYCPAGFCEDFPTEGGDCRGTGVCADGFFCIEDVCSVAKERGDACTNDCGGGLDCLEGVCVGANAAACWPDSPVGSV